MSVKSINTNRKPSLGQKLIRAAAVAAPLLAIVPAVQADFLYVGSFVGAGNGGVGTDGGYWFYGGPTYATSNWVNSSTPSVYIPAPSSGTLNINSNTNGNLPALGAIYDPANDPGAPNTSASTTVASLYISSSSSGVGTFGVQPNTMTMDSGAFESTTQIVVGRDGMGKLVVNGGSIYADATLTVGGNHSATINPSGIIAYHGGLLQGGISSAGNFYTGSSGGLRLGTGTLAVGSAGVGMGTLAVYNDKAGGAVDMESLFVGYASPSAGVLDFHYSNGGVRPVQITGNSGTASGGQLALRNYSLTPVPGPGGGIGSYLNMSLDSAPTLAAGVPNDLALVTYTAGIHGNSTDPKIFYDAPGSAVFNTVTDSVTYDTAGGSVPYAEGSEVDAVEGNTVYRWDIYYDGTVGFQNTVTVGQNTYSPDSIVSSIAQTGGNGGIGTETAGVGAVVLIGLGSYTLPEPATIGIAGAAVGLLLSRRRQRSGK